MSDPFQPAERIISIHAPRTGSDCRRSRCQFPANGFQSTLPARGATAVLIADLKKLLFQSTLPARGATDGNNARQKPKKFQSTLPARGATDDFSQLADFDTLFQSTLPARGATSGVHHVIPALYISIHAPRTGSDWRNRQCNRRRGTFQSTLPARGATSSTKQSAGASVISIHAPRTGSDNYESTWRLEDELFQSTLPARGATQYWGVPQRRKNFNPRSPHGERRGRRRSALWNQGISIHAPRTGSDRLNQESIIIRRISIHAPRTGSDAVSDDSDGHAHPISIHAPRTGSDQTGRMPESAPARDFNPRSPHGERLRREVPLHLLHRISIHAPRTGSDSPSSIITVKRSSFQSTLPARGATRSGVPAGFYPAFQSTLPARGATSFCREPRPFDLISIHAPRTGSDP